MTTMREKLVKIGAKIVRHGRYVIFQMAEVAVPRDLFADILRRIDRLRPKRAPARRRDWCVRYTARPAISDATTANRLAIPWYRHDRRRQNPLGCPPSDFESRSIVSGRLIWGNPRLDHRQSRQQALAAVDADHVERLALEVATVEIGEP